MVTFRLWRATQLAADLMHISMHSPGQRDLPGSGWAVGPPRKRSTEMMTELRNRTGNYGGTLDPGTCERLGSGRSAAKRKKQDMDEELTALFQQWLIAFEKTLSVTGNEEALVALAGTNCASQRHRPKGCVES